MQRGLLIGGAAREFALAGNARLTIVSKKTGERYTYKVVKNPKEGPVGHFVSVLRGSDNEQDYSYVGYLMDGFFQHGAKSHFGKDAACVRAFAWAWKNLAGHPLLEVWHEGRCGACGRTLTVPESVARGIGPECARKSGSLLQAALPLSPETSYGHGRRRVA